MYGLHNAGSTTPLIFVFDDFELDITALELRRAGVPIKADAQVLRLLSVLVRHAGELLSKQELIAQVWDNRVVSENVLTVAMARLRKTIRHYGGEDEVVANVHGRGYRFTRPVQLRAASSPALPAPESAFVGRDLVLQRLREHVRHALAGRGGACVLIGEAGIGKTRTLEMLEQESSALGMNVVWGFCREAGDTPPLSPLARIVREVLNHHTFERLAVKLGAGAAAELARLWPELSVPIKVARPATEPDPHTALTEAPLAKQRSFAAIARLFELAAEQRPWLFVLDDLQHADSATADFLQHWIVESTRTRIAWFATLRGAAADGGNVAPQLRSWIGHRNCERVRLTPLSEADVSAYVASVCDDAGGALGRAVFQKSEGNPFFMVELSRQLRAGEARDSALALPEAALELVRRRIASLDPQTQALLSYAAVIGRSFDLPLLQAASGCATDALMASLDRAASHAVIDGAPGSRIGFSFRHALLRDVCYEALSPAERRKHHLAVANALEQRVGQGLHVPPSDLAFHFYAAVPETDLRKTVRYCSDASLAAAAVYANSEVVHYLQHALEALALIPNASRRLRYKLSLRRALFLRALSAREFERAVREALQLAQELDDGALIGYAALLYCLHPGFPPLPGARDALELALTRIPEDDPKRGAMLARLSNLGPLAFDAAACEAPLTVALKLTRDRDRDAPLPRFAALSAQLYLKACDADRQPAAAAMNELVALCDAQPNLLTVPPVLIEHHRVILALQVADHAEAEAALARWEARARKLGHRELIWHVERLRALCRIDRAEHATGALQALHRQSAEQHILGTELFCAYDRALVLGEVSPVPEPALALESDDPPSIYAMKLRALVAVRAFDHARAALSRLPPENIARLPRDRDCLGTLGALTRVCSALGEAAYYAPLYAALASASGRFAIHLSGRCEGAVDQLQGLLCLAQGERARAREHLTRGLIECQSAGLARLSGEIERTLPECASDVLTRGRGSASSELLPAAVSGEEARAGGRASARAANRSR